MGNSHVTPFIIYMVASDIFFFHPDPWGNDAIWRPHRWVEPPPLRDSSARSGGPPPIVESLIFFDLRTWKTSSSPSFDFEHRTNDLRAEWCLSSRPEAWELLIDEESSYQRPMDGAEKKDWGKKLGRKEKKGGFIFIWKGPKKGKFMKLLNVVRNDPTGDYIYIWYVALYVYVYNRYIS